MAETTIRLDDRLKARIVDQLIGSESVAQFARRALEEKLNRLETRDERARMQILTRDKAMLRPIIQGMIDSGELSICTAGEEKYYEFYSEASQKWLVQYDYNTPDGRLFSCVRKTLEACRESRDNWIRSIKS